jgi:hypothetical protein
MSLTKNSNCKLKISIFCTQSSVRSVFVKFFSASVLFLSERESLLEESKNVHEGSQEPFGNIHAYQKLILNLFLE